MKRIILFGCIIALVEGFSLAAARHVQILTLAHGRLPTKGEAAMENRASTLNAGQEPVIINLTELQLDQNEMLISDLSDSPVRGIVPPGPLCDADRATIRAAHLFESGRQMLVASRQAHPPARAADPNQVLENECQALSTRADERYERSVARECPRPMLQVRISDDRLAYPSGEVIIAGAGGHRSDLVVALVDVETITRGRRVQERFFVRRLLQNFGGSNGFLGAGIPGDLGPGRYHLALLYRYSSRQASRPLFMKGSNAVGLRVRAGP
jgi:hypothetical protein